MMSCIQLFKMKDMIKYLFGISLFFWFFLVSSTSVMSETDILGWRKAKWGMTRAQIAKLYDVKPETTRGGLLRSTVKNKVNIQGHDFTVSFFFDKNTPDGKLNKVILRFDKEIYEFASLVGLYVSKYGKPESDRVEGSYSKTYIVLWLKPSGQIEIKIDGLGANSYGQISYIAIGNESDKI